MDKKEALTVLVRNHRNEFKEAVRKLQDSGLSQKKAKYTVTGLLANKYQNEYVTLRGNDLKGRL